MQPVERQEERLEPEWFQLRDPRKALELKAIQDARFEATVRGRKPAPGNPEKWRKEPLLGFGESNLPWFRALAQAAFLANHLVSSHQGGIRLSKKKLAELERTIGWAEVNWLVERACRLKGIGCPPMYLRSREVDPAVEEAVKAKPGVPKIPDDGVVAPEPEKLAHAKQILKQAEELAGIKTTVVPPELSKDDLSRNEGQQPIGDNTNLSRNGRPRLSRSERRKAELALKRAIEAEAKKPNP